MNLSETLSVSVSPVKRSPEEFSKFRNENKFFDASLRLSDGTVIPVHRIVLSLQSEYFEVLFTSPLKSMNGASPGEFLIPGVRKEIVEKILNYLYTQEIEFDFAEIFELLTVSDYFLINKLTEKCKKFIVNSLSVENCVRILLFAEGRSHIDLSKSVQKFILVNFLKVMNNPDFNILSFEHFYKILSNDWLNVKDELCVWNACVNWINNSRDERKKVIYQLVSLVRTGLMNIEDVREMKQHPFIVECSKSRLLLENVSNFLTKGELSNNILQYKLALPRLPHEVIVTLGGWSEGSAKMEIETYDTRADRWIRSKNEDPFGPRAYHGSIAIGGKIYCIGGFNGREYFNNCRIFDTVTRHWYPMSSMIMRRCYVSVALLDGVIYALGGYDGNMRQRSCEKYDLKTNQWTMIAPMNAPRSDACACVMDGKIYIVGGFNGQECMNTGEVYDAQEDTWSLIPRMIQRRSGLRCIAHKGRIYAIGGFNGLVRLKHCEQFNPVTQQWNSIAEMFSPRSNFAIEIIDDMIFAMAGFNGTFTISEVECYDPEMDEWLMAMSMNVVRSALTANIIRGTPNIQDYLHPCRPALIEERRQMCIQQSDESDESGEIENP